ncbi:MAG: hypothetical protein HGA96_16600 [Desulfobulbaceae bacterium]|nr:hypothetical protein [Desulfobulbaceae bacterium]
MQDKKESLVEIMKRISQALREESEANANRAVGPGLLFSLPIPSSCMPARYLILEEVEDHFFCLRVGIGDEHLAGPWDRPWQGLIIESWNGALVPARLVTKGDSLVPEEILEECRTLRQRFVEGAVTAAPDAETAPEPLSVERECFRHAETMANLVFLESLENEARPWPAVPVWKEIGVLQPVADFGDIGALSATVYRDSLLLGWQGTSNPPELTVWDAENGFHVRIRSLEGPAVPGLASVWREVAAGVWRLALRLPPMSTHVALAGLGAAVLLELLPEAREAVTLGERLYQTYLRTTATDILSTWPVALMKPDFAAGEYAILAKAKGIWPPRGVAGHTGLALAVACNCPGLPETYRLELFQMVACMVEQCPVKETSEGGFASLAADLYTWNVSNSGPNWLIDKVARCWDEAVAKQVIDFRILPPSLPPKPADFALAAADYADHLFKWSSILQQAWQVNQGLVSIKETLIPLLWPKLSQPEGVWTGNFGRAEDAAAACELALTVPAAASWRGPLAPEDWGEPVTAGAIRRYIAARQEQGGCYAGLRLLRDGEIEAIEPAPLPGGWDDPSGVEPDAPQRCEALLITLGGAGTEEMERLDHEVMALLAILTGETEPQSPPAGEWIAYLFTPFND